MITQPRIGFLLLLPATLALFALTTSSVSAQETVSIDVGDTYFCDASFQGGVCTTTISAGDTVSWDFGGATLAHSTTECGNDCSSPSGSPVWNSSIVSDGSTFQHTFDDAGTYAYYCQVHSASLMQGQIVVQGASGQPTTAATTSATAPTGGAAATATPGAIGAPTTGGGATPGDSSDSWWLLAALAGAGAALTGLGAFAYRMRPHT